MWVLCKKMNFLFSREETFFRPFLFCEKEKRHKRKNYGVCLLTRLKRASVVASQQPVHVNPTEDLRHQGGTAAPRGGVRVTLR